MKLLFLDIDGVLNDHAYSDLAESNTIKPECVYNLNHILVQTGAKIVLSSAWRYMILGGAMSPVGFDYLLRTHGVKADVLHDYISPDIEDDKSNRGLLIGAWLLNRPLSGIENYVVIDDMVTELQIDQYHPENFVCTNGKVGLTFEDAERAIKILRKTA